MFKSKMKSKKERNVKKTKMIKNTGIGAYGQAIRKVIDYAPQYLTKNGRKEKLTKTLFKFGS